MLTVSNQCDRLAPQMHVVHTDLVPHGLPTIDECEARTHGNHTHSLVDMVYFHQAPEGGSDLFVFEAMVTSL